MTILIICIVTLSLLLYLGWHYHVADWGSFFINVIDGWIRLFARYYHGFIYEPIPVGTSGAKLLACNHLSGLDPFLLVAASQRPIRFMMAKEEYQRFGLQWLFRASQCIPVDRRGRVEKAFKETLSALHNGEVVALFPEGGIHRRANAPERLKPGIVKLAKLSGVAITPMKLSGIKAEGYTVLAVLVPGKVQLRVYPEIHCSETNNEDCLHRLRLVLQQDNGRKK